MDRIFVPTLSHWQLGNFWSGSFGRASYHVAPETGEEGGEGRLFVQAWTGPGCYEISHAERTAYFPITEEGLAAMRAWLEENLAQIDAAARAEQAP